MHTELITIEHNGIRHEIVESPDDGGWYVQRLSDDFVSIDVYDSAREAIDALRGDRVEWEI